MSFVLTPKSTSARSAELWVATRSRPPGNLELKAGRRSVPLSGSWAEFHQPGDSKELYHQTVTVDSLAPGSRTRVSLVRGGQRLAHAVITTLPDRLPGPDRGFTVLLGSCFCNAKDSGSNVERAFSRIPRDLKPDIKILCGDQVYLDAPWTHYSTSRHSAKEMRKRFLLNYWTTWAGGTSGGSMRRGLQGLLRNGANYFLSDDHEFWNNYPNRAVLVRDSWRAGGRRKWQRTARSLFAAFQSPRGFETFDVAPLSFAVVDARGRRDADEKLFMPESVLKQVGQWVGGLRGVGVLVLPQLVFEKKRGFRGHVTDWGLPDYDQFHGLARILSSSRRPIMVLTGDVHYRRVAHCKLPHSDLFEIVSSPLALVDKRSGGKWSAPPKRFPDEAIAGVPRVPVTTEPAVRAHADAFVLLRFSAVAGAAARVELFEVPVDEPVDVQRPTWSAKIGGPVTSTSAVLGRIARSSIRTNRSQPTP